MTPSEESKLTASPEIFCPDCTERFDEPHAGFCSVGSLTACHVCEAPLVCTRTDGRDWLWELASEEDQEG